MKSTLLLFVLLAMATASFGQKLKKVTLDRVVGCLMTTEVFHVKPDQPEIRQGEYKETTRFFEVKGQYENGVKAGVWEYSNRREVVQRYDFTNKKVVTSVPSSGPVKSWILDDEGNVVRELNEMPLYLGGPSHFYSYFGPCLRFPEEASAKKKGGIVTIMVVINKQGKLVNPTVTDDPGYGYADVALQAVKGIPNEWIPYAVDGKAVDVRMEIKANFSFGR